MPEIKMFRIEELFHDEKQGDKIIFSSIEELEKAHKEINDGKDIYVVMGEQVIKSLNQDVSAKIYDGRIRLAAKIQSPKGL
jgi:hypothetical protein